MKKLLTLLSFLFLIQGLYSQLTLWAVKDGGTPNENGKAIYTDKQGYSYVTGTFDGTATIAGNTFVSRGSTDVYLMKLDPNGNILWSTSMGSNTTDNCKAIFVGSDNNVYIGGTYTNNNFYFSTTDSVTHVSGNGIEAFYAKYSPTGVLLSKWRDGEFSKDFDINDIIVTSAGEVVAGGNATQSGTNRVYLKRFNTSGGIIWSKTTNYGYVTGLALNAAGTTLYASGTYTTGFNPMGSAESTFGNSDIFYVLVTMSGGAYTYCHNIGSAGVDYGKDIELDANGDALLGCQYSGTMNIGSSITLPTGSLDAVVIKYNSTYQVQWYRRSATNSTDISKMRVDQYNNVFVHGLANGGAWSHNGSLVVGVYNLKLHHTNGNILWRTGVASTTQGGIGIDSVGNIYTTGSFTGTKNFGGISLTSAGGNDLVVYKQGSINILKPSMTGVKCANNEYGDTVGVLAQPTYPLDPSNIYTVEIDTISTFIFSSPLTIGTLAGNASPALIVCTIPAGTDPTFASIRVKTSNLLNTGEDIYLNMYEKPQITSTPSHTLYKCINGASGHIAAVTTEPDGFGTSSWVWAPTTSLTHNEGFGTSDGYTTANAPITYTITVTSTNTCKDTQVVHVLQYPALVLEVGNDTTICQGTSMVMNPSVNNPGAIASCQWTPVGAFTNANILNAVLSNPSAGMTHYNLVVYDTNGCMVQDGRYITRLITPTVNAGLPQYTSCLGAPFQLIATGTSINTFSWTPSIYVNNPTNDTVLVNAPATTTFTVTATNSNGCSKQDTVRINLGPIVVNAGTDATITCGNSTNLTASTTGIYQTPLSYSWSPPTGLTTTTGATVSAHPIITTPYTVTLTTANGCTGTDVVNVNVNGANFPINFSATPQSFAAPPFNVMFSNTTTGIGNYNFTWDFGDGNTLATNNGTVFHTYTNNGTYDVMLIAVSNTTGCADTLFQGSYIFCSGAVTCTLSANINTPDGLTTCIGDSLLLTCNTGAGYGYQWRLNTVDIPGATSPSYYATQSGNYSVQIIQNVNCSAVSSPVTLTIVSNPDFGVSFSATPQLFTSQPFTSQFTNSTPNPSNYNFTWYWGDGQSTASNNGTVFYTYLLNGTYDVALVATNISTGCQDSVFQGSYIFCSGGTNCTLSANINSPNGLSACIGDSVLLSCNVSAGNTYQWKLNGSNISGATSSTYYAIQSGSYSVEITESPTCNAISSPVTVTINSAPSAPVITQSGSLYDCGTDTIILSANTGYAGYLWNTSAITQSIQVVTPGTYQVTVSDPQGCTNTASYILSLVSYAAPPICIVGVDSITSHNLIVWNNDSLAVIDSFIVYREGSIINQYDRIGAQSSTLFSTFLDGSSNPFQQAYRYKISQKDSCGNESPLSAHHCTIHLTVNAGVGSTWNLLWNFYEGFTVPTYRIYRGTTPSNISFLTSLSGSNNSYSDLTPPPGIVYYQIEIIANNCDPSEGRSYNSSRSNIVNTNTTSIQNETIENSILLMPNPSTGFVTVQIENSALGNNEVKLELIDKSGRVVYIKNIYANGGLVKENLSLEHLAKGVYTVRIISGPFAATEKIVLVNN